MSRSKRLDWLRHATAEATPGACVDWPGAMFSNGYGSVRHEGRNRGAHRVALILHSGQDPDHLVAAHDCGRKECCNPHHLQWKTPTQNETDKERHGTKLFGEAVPAARLSAQQVLVAYHDPRPAASLARELGVSDQAIHRLRCGETWAWLTGAEGHDR